MPSKGYREVDSKLDLDLGVVESCRQAAARIADRIARETAGKTTVSVERTVTRFLGVDGINELDIPLPNVLVDHVRDRVGLGRGVAYWLGNGMLQTGRSAGVLAEAVGASELDLCALPQAEEGSVRELVARECEQRMGEVSRRRDERMEMRERLGDGTPPLRYMLTATGNVYEDVVHSVAVAEAGGDVVSMTRSTAQSLLEYVP
jgi:beta-lysine 5,6-aminomutase alpha subunit